MYIMDWFLKAGQYEIPHIDCQQPSSRSDGAVPVYDF